MRKLTIKQRKWLDSFLTDFNKAQAARDAGYKCNSEQAFRTIGMENYTKLYSHIAKWMDESGLSDTKIKLKISEGMEAVETRFFQKDGLVITEKEVAALSIQYRYTDLAASIRGMKDSEIGRRLDDLERKIDEVMANA